MTSVVRRQCHHVRVLCGVEELGRHHHLLLVCIWSFALVDKIKELCLAVSSTCSSCSYSTAIVEALPVSFRLILLFVPLSIILR